MNLKWIDHPNHIWSIACLDFSHSGFPLLGYLTICIWDSATGKIKTARAACAALSIVLPWKTSDVQVPSCGSHLPLHGSILSRTMPYGDLAYHPHQCSSTVLQVYPQENHHRNTEPAQKHHRSTNRNNEYFDLPSKTKTINWLIIHDFQKQNNCCF